MSAGGEPIRARGVVAPGYGEFLTAGGDLLPWSWAEERLAASRNYWLSTTNRDASAHAMPVWGVWRDGRLYFSTGPRTRKRRNIERDARVSVTTERGDEAVVVEGRAEPQGARLPGGIIGAYNEKYAWNMPVDDDSFIAIVPARVFGFYELPERATGRPTCWEFTPR